MTQEMTTHGYLAAGWSNCFSKTLDGVSEGLREIAPALGVKHDTVEELWARLGERLVEANVENLARYLRPIHDQPLRG